MPQNENEGIQPTVLNMVLLGTDYHRTQVNERHILTDLVETIATGPNQSVHLIDGLGAEPIKNHPKALNHPMLGTYDFECKYNNETGEINSVKTLKPFYRRATAIGGKLLGSGYKDAMDEATKVVEAMIKAGKKPLVINMYGFSRGADTALRICNRLHTIYKKEDVKVNILAVDPVPGTFRRVASKAQFIPDNVGEYHSILMENENLFGFEPQDKRRQSAQDAATVTTHKIYGGNHGMALRINANPFQLALQDDRNSNTVDSTQLLWDDVHKFAKRNGTVLRHDIPYIQRITNKDNVTWKEYKSTPLSDEERLQAYTRMVANKKIYRQYTPMLSKLNEREFLAKKEDYFLHGANYFQDNEHQALFRKNYPFYFDYFFQNNKGKSSKLEVMGDIDKMKNDFYLINSLDATGLPGIRNLKTLDDTPPQGINLTLEELDGELRNLWEGVLGIVNAVLTGQDNSTSKKKSEDLRNKVYTILTSDQDKAQKIEAILTLNEKTIQGYKNENTIFVRKLTSFSPVKFKSKSTYSSLIMEKLEKYTTKKGTHNEILMNQEIALANKTIEILYHIDQLGMGYDKESLNRVLNTAMMASQNLRVEYKEDEGKLDKLLRKKLIEISQFSVMPKTDQQRDALDFLLKKFESEVDKIKHPGQEEKEAYTPVKIAKT